MASTVRQPSTGVLDESDESDESTGRRRASPANPQVIGTDDPQGGWSKIAPMSTSLRRSTPRPRRHGLILEPEDRRVLERSGWRTTLDYRENHVRARDGRLLEVVPEWTAEAERFDGDVVVASAAGATIEEAWARLIDEIQAHRATTTSRVRLLRP